MNRYKIFLNVVLPLKAFLLTHVEQKWSFFQRIIRLQSFYQIFLGQF